jgi:hypothetical protein
VPVMLEDGGDLTADDGSDAMTAYDPVEQLAATAAEAIDKGLALYKGGEYREALAAFTGALDLPGRVAASLTPAWCHQISYTDHTGYRQLSVFCDCKINNVVQKSAANSLLPRHGSHPAPESKGDAGGPVAGVRGRGREPERADRHPLQLRVLPRAAGGPASRAGVLSALHGGWLRRLRQRPGRAGTPLPGVTLAMLTFCCRQKTHTESTLHSTVLAVVKWMCFDAQQ